MGGIKSHSVASFIVITTIQDTYAPGMTGDRHVMKCKFKSLDSVTFRSRS